MGEARHYSKGFGVEESEEYYDECRARSEPCISLYDQERGFVVISVDLSPMYDCESPGAITHIIELLNGMYATYCERFEMPVGRFMAEGAIGSFALLVHERQAELWAEGLYEFLVGCRGDAREDASGRWEGGMPAGTQACDLPSA